MIEIENLIKTHNDFELNIDQLSITEPAVVLIRGKNGSGKTTFLELLLDLIKRDSGVIRFFGEEIYTTEKWTRKTSAYLHEGFLIGYLKPLEYFQFISILKNAPSDVNETIKFSGSGFFDPALINSNLRISSLSKGQKTKVGIIGSLIGNPKIIIFDEPLAHLDHESKIHFKELINNFVTLNGSIVILADHGHLFDTLTCNVLEVTLDKGKLIQLS